MAFKYKGLRLKDPSLMKKLRQVPLTFTRASVAYDYKGDAVGVDTPRFQHLINGVMEYGCLIEEAHTNILPASQSQSLSEAYTTAALNGTYTFQCEGTGSYELSGGATGTVSKDNPVTAAISSATVTLTPTGTSTLNQILNKAYPLSYTLGGTTQAVETLTAPSSVLNINNDGTGEMTVEVEFLINNITTTKNVIYFLEASGKNAWIMDINTSTIRNLVYDSSGKYKYRQHPSPLQINTLYRMGMSLGGGNLEIYQNAVKSGTGYVSDGGSGMITAYPPIIFFGGNSSGGPRLNGLLRNVVITKSRRGDTDVITRAAWPGLIVDRQVSLITSLIRDLKAYRVRT